MDRGDVLRKCADLLDKYREEIAYTEVRDIAKPITEARFDVQSAIDSMKYHGGTAPGTFENLRLLNYHANK